MPRRRRGALHPLAIQVPLSADLFGGVGRTYARRSSYVFEPSNEFFSTELDRPNNPDMPDMYLGLFEF
jgi:hypothetical protein